MHWIMALTLDDHAVQNHTTVYHLPHLLIRPYQSRVPNDSKALLQHSKCLLDVLPGSLLFTGEMTSFVPERVGDALHNVALLG